MLEYLIEKIENVKLLELLKVEEYSYSLIKEIINFLKKNKIKVKQEASRRSKVNLLKHDIFFNTHESHLNYNISFVLSYSEKTLKIIFVWNTPRTDQIIKKDYKIDIEKNTTIKEVLDFLLENFKDFKSFLIKNFKKESDIFSFKENKKYNLEDLTDKLKDEYIYYHIVKLVKEEKFSYYRIRIMLNVKNLLEKNEINENLLKIISKNSKLLKNIEDTQLFLKNKILLNFLEGIKNKKEEIINNIETFLKTIYDKEYLVYRTYSSVLINNTVYFLENYEDIAKNNNLNLYNLIGKNDVNIDLFYFRVVDKDDADKVRRKISREEKSLFIYNRYDILLREMKKIIINIISNNNINRIKNNILMNIDKNEIKYEIIKLLLIEG